MHGDSADQIAEKLGPDGIRNDHYGKERSQSGEQYCIDADHDRGLLKIAQLGMCDLAVYLRERLFAAHRQYRVSEAEQQDEQGGMGKPGALQGT